MTTINIRYSILLLLTILFFVNNRAISKNSPNISLDRMKEITTNDLDEYILFLKYKDTDSLIAAKYATSFISTLEYKNADTIIADIYEFLADYHGKTIFKFKTAIFFQNRATEIYQELNLPFKECLSEVKSAKYNNNVGKYHIALSQTLSSLQKAKDSKNSFCIRECYLNLGLIYYYCNEPNKSIKYYKMVSSNSSNIEEDHQRVQALNNLLPFTNNLRERDSLIKIGISICNRNNFKSIKQLIYLNLSLAQMKDGNMPKCKHFLDTSLNFAVNFRDTGYFHTNSGIYYMEVKDTTSAITHFNKAINYLSRGDFDSEVKYILNFIQNLYAKTSQPQKAYDALLRYYTIDNKLAKDETLREIFKLQKKIDISNLEQDSYREKTKIRTISLLLIIILLIIIFILFIIYYRRNLELKENKIHQEKINQDLKSKNDIINIKRLQQHQENNFIDNIIKQLNELSNKTTSTNIRSEISSMTRQLNQSKDKSDWTEVEKSLQEFNSNFYNNLIKEFPELTPNDRRLCTLIHMNMSTKEISAITHQSIGSINTARTRLRKKLNITGDDKSLITFLDTFN